MAIISSSAIPRPTSPTEQIMKLLGRAAAKEFYVKDSTWLINGQTVVAIKRRNIAVWQQTPAYLPPEAYSAMASIQITIVKVFFYWCPPPYVRARASSTKNRGCCHGREPLT
jgi:hypothetical protein